MSPLLAGRQLGQTPTAEQNISSLITDTPGSKSLPQIHEYIILEIIFTLSTSKTILEGEICAHDQLKTLCCYHRCFCILVLYQFENCGLWWQVIELRPVKSVPICVFLIFEWKSDSVRVQHAFIMLTFVCDKVIAYMKGALTCPDPIP